MKKKLLAGGVLMAIAGGAFLFAGNGTGTANADSFRLGINSRNFGVSFVDRDHDRNNRDRFERERLERERIAREQSWRFRRDCR